MEFLKKNGFAVSLGVLALGALVLLWFMMGVKLLGFSETRTALIDIEKKMRDYADPKKYPFIPSEKTNTRMAEWEKKWDEAYKEGLQYYDDRKEQFDQMHEKFTSPAGFDDASGFSTFYQTEVDRLRKEYQTKFLPQQEAAPPDGQAPAPGPSGPGTKDVLELPPKINKMMKINDREDVQRAMRELWILTEVFARATELNIGGLQSIDFPEREKAAAVDPSAPKEFRWIRSKVIINMPFGQIEPFLSKLFQSDRVSFRLDSLEMEKLKEALVVPLVDFRQKEKEAPGTTPDKLPPEPPAQFRLDLSALVWIGPTAETAPVPEKEKEKE